MKIINTICLLLLPFLLWSQDSNDECVNAIMITLGDDFTQGTIIDHTANATPSNVDSGECSYVPAGVEDYDLWYSFVAPASGEAYFIFDGAVMALFDGTCGSLSYLQCLGNGNATGLIAGQTYFIKAFYFENGFSFKIEIFEPSNPPINDECSGAISISVSNGDCSPTFVQYRGLATDGIPAGGNCYDSENHDLWYQFTAPNSGSIVWEESTEYNSYFAVFEANCNSLVVLACGYSTSEVTGLIPGNNYYLRVGAFNTEKYEFCLKEGPPPPANDECTNSTNIIVETNSCNTNITGTLSGASASTTLTDCYEEYVDVWFDFVAPPNGSIVLTNNISGVMRTGVYSGDCSNPTLVSCEFTSSTPEVIGGLTPGAAYLLRIADNDPIDSNYDFCIEEGDPPPANDDCANAEAVLYNTVVNASTFLAAPSTEMNPYCSDLTTTKDVWYTITPTTGNGNIRIDADQYSSLALYEGSCGAFTDVQCHINYTGVRQYNGLTVGSTYYLRVWDIISSSNFQFSWYNNSATGPTNDNCANALIATVGIGTCEEFVVTNNGANSNFEEGTPTCEYNGGDIWYDVVAPSTGNIDFEHHFFTDVSSIGVAVYEGACGSLSEVSCDPTVLKNKHVYMQGLTPGNLYKFRIWQEGFDEYNNIEICLKEGIATPPNDDCTDAINLAVESSGCTTIAVNNLFATGSAEIPGSCSDNTFKDVWYSFTATAAGSVIFDKSESSTYFIGLYEGSCGGLVEKACREGSTVENFGGLISGQSYFLRLWSEDDTDFGDMEFCLKEGLPIPPNDLCSGAINLPIDTGTSCINNTQGYTLNATDSGEGAVGCNYEKDIWYSFTCPASGTVDLDLQSSDYTAYYQIYEGSCGSLSELVICNELEIGENLTGNMTAGDTYYLRLWHHNNSEGFIDFCLLEGPTLPANNVCTGATVVTVGDDECGTETNASFANATNSNTVSCNPYGQNTDLWYSFAAPPSGEVNIVYANYLGNDDKGLEVFSGDCNTFTSIECINYRYEDSPFYLDNLTPGEMYHIMAFSENSNVDFCISGIPITAINNECVNAITITESASENCENTITTTTYGGMDEFGDCQSDSEEVFYQFTPSQSGNYTITTSNRNFDLGISIFEGDCTTDQMGCFENETIVPLEEGITYTLAIATIDNNKFTEFDICIYPFSSANAQNVGVNINNPIQNLQVKDGIMIGNTIVEAPGSIRYNGSDIEAYLGTDWVSLSSASATDNLGDHSATEAIDMNGQKISELATPTISTDAANKSYVDNHSDGDASSTNERISSLSLDGTVLTVIESTNTKTVDLSSLAGGSDNLGDHAATESLNMNSNTIINLSTPIQNEDAATKAYVDAHVDADSDPTNEIETWATLAGVPVDFTDGIDNVDDADANSTNEIQSLSISDNDITLSNGGGMINLDDLAVHEISDDDGDTNISFDNGSDQLIITTDGNTTLTVESDSAYLNGNLQIGTGIGAKVYIGDEVLTDGGANLLRADANFTPATNDALNLGGASFRWQNVFLSNKLNISTGEIYEDGTDRLRTDSHWTPKNNSAKDLGESTLRWRDAHIDRFMYLNESYLEGKSIGGNDVIESSTNFRPATDNAAQLGSGSKRWSEVFAANGVINTSDRKAKTNITNLSYGLKEIMQLHAVQFDWKEGKNEVQNLGLIAQELQKIIPEVVVDSGSENLLGVKYADIIPVLIKAMQEQQAIIKAQETDLKNYESLLSTFASRLNELDERFAIFQKTVISDED